MISLLILLSFIRQISTRAWETGEEGAGGALLLKEEPVYHSSTEWPSEEVGRTR